MLSFLSQILFFYIFPLLSKYLQISENFFFKTWAIKFLFNYSHVNVGDCKFMFETGKKGHYFSISRQDK